MEKGKKIRPRGGGLAAGLKKSYLSGAARTGPVFGLSPKKKEKEMKKFSKMTADEFVATLQAEEKQRDKERNKAKGSGSKDSIKRHKRRNR